MIEDKLLGYLGKQIQQTKNHNKLKKYIMEQQHHYFHKQINH